MTYADTVRTLNVPELEAAVRELSRDLAGATSAKKWDCVTSLIDMLLTANTELNRKRATYTSKPWWTDHKPRHGVR